MCNPVLYNKWTWLNDSFHWIILEEQFSFGVEMFDPMIIYHGYCSAIRLDGWIRHYKRVAVFVDEEIKPTGSLLLKMEYFFLFTSSIFPAKNRFLLLLTLTVSCICWTPLRQENEVLGKDYCFIHTLIGLPVSATNRCYTWLAGLNFWECGSIGPFYVEKNNTALEVRRHRPFSCDHQDQDSVVTVTEVARRPSKTTRLIPTQALKTEYS